MLWICALESDPPMGIRLLTTADLMEDAAFFIWSKFVSGPGPLTLPLPWQPLPVAQLFWIMGLTSVANFAGVVAQDDGGGSGAGSPVPEPLLHAVTTITTITNDIINKKLFFILVFYGFKWRCKSPLYEIFKQSPNPSDLIPECGGAPSYHRKNPI